MGEIRQGNSRHKTLISLASVTVPTRGRECWGKKRIAWDLGDVIERGEGRGGDTHTRWV